MILYLDDQGIQYIKVFERYANLVSLSEKTNYIKSTFLTLAFSNEAILNLLASWGATFQGHGEEAEKYLIQSKELVKSCPIDRFDYFTSVAYNLIQMAIYIHRGDTKIGMIFLKM